MQGAVGCNGQPRIRAAALSLVVGYAALLGWLELAPEPRAELHARLVFALGYGHLLASVAWRRAERTSKAPASTLVRGALLVAVYALYSELCRVWPLLPIALLALSAWHTVENDRAIRRSSLQDASPIAPVSLRRRDIAIDASAAASIGALALALPSLFPVVETADIVAAFSLHHLVSWLILIAARARARGQHRETLMRLLRLHLPMMVICAGAVATVDASASLPRPIIEAAETILSPATYLFWSAAHALHTAWRRGVS